MDIEASSLARTEYQERKALENCRTAESTYRIVVHMKLIGTGDYLVGTKGYPKKQGTRYLKLYLIPLSNLKNLSKATYNP